METRGFGDIELRRVRKHVWEIPREGEMNTPARVLVSEALFDHIGDDKTFKQLRNAAHLPGITKHVICMPDGHQGYGFPVGGVGVADAADDCLSPGTVGYDINCGVWMMATNLIYEDLQGHEEKLVDALFEAVPSGLGGGGAVKGDAETIEDILVCGMRWAVGAGYAADDDLAHCEDEGFRDDARPGFVSQKTKDRGRNQIGSLDSGNHFPEVQHITDVYHDDMAESFGLEAGQIVVPIHCDSRGLGHQTCTDYLRHIEQEHADLFDDLSDKELAATPAGFELVKEYYGAMCTAINFVWVNRQFIMHRTREVFADVFDRDWRDMEMRLLYDVAHNIAKKEVHMIDGEERELCVHRKGATRALPAGRLELPPAYADVGQLVIIPGSMGAGSYVLRGDDQLLDLTFGSTAHGAGRLMSRTKAEQERWGETVQDELREQKKIYVKTQLGATVAEEASGVYKNVDEVARVSDELGIGDKVARTSPVCSIEG